MVFSILWFSHDYVSVSGDTSLVLLACVDYTLF